MELKEYIGLELDGMERVMTRVMNGLTQQESAWRPASGNNSIGLIFFHMTKVEDSFVQVRMQGKPDVWEAEKWYQQLNLLANEAGAHYTVEQVNAFPVPDIKGLLAYSGRVREKTREYLKSMTAEMFDKIINMPRLGDIRIGGVFTVMMNHISGHIGEISYLRGLQRGMDK